MEKNESLRALQLLASQAEAIVQQMNVIQSAISEARETIEAMKALEAPSEILYPLGSGVYLQGEVKSAENVLMSVGSGVVVRKSREDAISVLEERIKEMTKRLEELATRYNEISAEVEKIRAQLEEKK
ncbi:MAG: prefoldin alpha subunit [Archaeoglobi archaeon]|nr:prefoldin alpha subunit [Archaeoglobi archaeon]